MERVLRSGFVAYCFCCEGARGAWVLSFERVGCSSSLWLDRARARSCYTAGMSGERAAEAEELQRCESCSRQARPGVTRCVYCGRSASRRESELAWWIPRVERPRDAWVGIAPGQHSARAVDDASRVLLLPSHVVDQRLRRPTTWFHPYPTTSRADAVHQLLEKSSLRSARFDAEDLDALPPVVTPTALTASEDTIVISDHTGGREEHAMSDARFVLFGTLGVRHVRERSSSPVLPSSPRTRRVEWASRTVLDLYFPERIVRVLERSCEVGGLGLAAHQRSLALGVLKSRFVARGIAADGKSHRFDVSACAESLTPTGRPRRQRVERDAMGQDTLVENVTDDWDLWSARGYLVHARLRGSQAAATDVVRR